MSQLEVFRNSKEAEQNNHVFLRNMTDHAWFEPVTESNKGFKFNFFFVRGKSKAKEDAWAKLFVPMSWSWDYYDHNNGALNVHFQNLVGDNKESFDLLKEWGTRLKGGLKKLKLSCEEIIKVEAEFKDSLGALLSKFS